jgi:hypothetical protein
MILTNKAKNTWSFEIQRKNKIKMEVLSKGIKVLVI